MWIVDTCIIIDLYEECPVFGEVSTQCLESVEAEGLAACPVSLVELAPAFAGNMSLQKEFLSTAFISFTEPWTSQDTETAHEAWARVTLARRKERLPRRPVADILIGAFAANRTGLVTRNPEDFRRWFPRLRIKSPHAP